MKFGYVLTGLLAAGVFAFAAGDGYESTGYGSAGDIGYPGTIGYEDVDPSQPGVQSNSSQETAIAEKKTRLILETGFACISFRDLPSRFSDDDVSGANFAVGFQRSLTSQSTQVEFLLEGLLNLAYREGTLTSRDDDYYDDYQVDMLDGGIRFAGFVRINLDRFFLAAGFQLGYDWGGLAQGNPAAISDACDESDCDEFVTGITMTFPLDFGMRFGSHVLGLRFGIDVFHPYDEYDATTFDFNVYIGL